MKVAAEISFYPISDKGITLIEEFITRLNRYENVKVLTNDLSTQLFGQYEEVMEILTREIKTTFEKEVKSVFVLKLHNPS